MYIYIYISCIDNTGNPNTDTVIPNELSLSFPIVRKVAMWQERQYAPPLRGPVPNTPYRNTPTGSISPGVNIEVNDPCCMTLITDPVQYLHSDLPLKWPFQLIIKLPSHKLHTY